MTGTQHTPGPFRTHTGECVQPGPRLQAALDAVADDWAEMARRARAEDLYAAHVAEAIKERRLNEGLAFAEEIRHGRVDIFSVWQRINTKLTGECVGFLPAQ